MICHDLLSFVFVVFSESLCPLHWGGTRALLAPPPAFSIALAAFSLGFFSPKKTFFLILCAVLRSLHHIISARCRQGFKGRRQHGRGNADIPFARTSLRDGAIWLGLPRKRRCVTCCQGRFAAACGMRSLSCGFEWLQRPPPLPTLDVKLLFVVASKRTRLVMTDAASKRVLLNHYVQSEAALRQAPSEQVRPRNRARVCAITAN